MAPQRLDRLGNGRALVTTELHPAIDEAYLARVHTRLDGCTVTSLAGHANGDGASADEESVRACARLAREGHNPVATLTCRDFRAESDAPLLALARAGVRNALVLYGDPHPRKEDNVYDFKSASALIAHIRAREQALELAPLCLLAAADPTQPGARAQAVAAARKIEAGADMVMTQPVFGAAQARAFLDAMARCAPDVPVLVGALAMRGPKSPAFLEKRLGVRVPASARARMQQGREGEGLRIAQETVLALRARVAGFHIYPFGVPEAAVRLIEGLRRA